MFAGGMHAGTRGMRSVGSVDMDARAWRDSVVGAGSAVSSTQISRLSAMIRYLKATNAWSGIDDMGVLAAENSVQSLTSVKQRRLGVAVGSPTFAAKRGVVFNGSSSYIKTGFIFSSHATAATGSNMGAGTYEIDNFANPSESIGVIIGTNQRLELYPRTGGGILFGNSNCADLTGPAVADSSGLSSVYRTAAPEFGFRKNGTLAGTATPGSSGTSLPNTELYVGARNNAGTAQNFRATTQAFWWAGNLTLAQEASLYAAVQSYLLSVGALDTYLSAGGSDTTGNGSASAPYATIAKAISNTPPGGTIWFDGDPLSPTLYKFAAGAVIDKALNFRAINPRGATLAGGDTNKIVAVGPAAGETITFRDLIFDAAQNTGGAAARCVDLSSVSVTYNFTATNCSFVGWTDLGVNNQSSSFKSNVTLNGCQFTGGDVRSAVYFSNFIAGGLVVNGGSVTLTSQNTSGHGGIIVRALAAGVVFNALNVDVSVTLKAALTGSGTHYGVRGENIANGLIKGGTHQVLGKPGSRDSFVTGFSTNGAGDSTEIPCSNSAVVGVNIVNTTNGGVGAYTSNDTSGSFKKSIAPYITDCIMDVGVAHGVFIANATGGYGARNTLLSVGIGLITKWCDGQSYHEDSTVNGAGIAMEAKGAPDSVFRRNTIGLSAGNNPGGIISEEVDGIPSTNVIVEDNRFVVIGSTNALFVQVQDTSSIIARRNDYRFVSGSLAGNPWQLPSTNYSTFAAWKAANEPTATSNIA